MDPLDTPSFRKLVDARASPAMATGNLPSSDENAKSIRENCPKKFTPLFHEIRNVKKGLIAEYVLADLPLDPYFEVAVAIQDCLRGQPRPDESHVEIPDWPEIIRLAKVRCELYPQTYRQTLEFRRTQENRAFSLASAARRLREKGYICEIRACAPYFSDSERVKIVEAIEKRITALGALGVIDHLCRILSQQYVPKMERYLLPSGLSSTPHLKIPALPINFLLQLTLKHLHVKGAASVNPQEEWEELEKLAIDFAALYDVEPYSHWDLEFIDANTIIPYTTDLALHDRLFGVRQYRASDVGKTLKGLFKWVPVEIEQAIGWTISDACAVAETILSRVKSNGPTHLKKSELISACTSVAPSKADAILTVFTHQADPNQGSVLPEVPGKLTFFGKPLISIDGENLVMIDRAICAPCFYEAVAASVRPHDNQTQNRVGVAAEHFLTNEMRGSGMTVVSGIYQCPEGDGECDAVVETDDTIIFLELKGKPLTNAAQAGSDVKILLDLLKSLVDATFQANQHDLILRQRGHLPLKQPNGSVYRLELKGRHIEKVAVTLLDFGRFQDRTVLSQFLRVLVSTAFAPSSPDPDLIKEFAKFNDKATKMRQQIIELAKFDKRLESQPFFPCWFLSIPQLLILLDGVTSNESFKKELWRTRHMTTHSLDWYFERNYALKLSGA